MKKLYILDVSGYVFRAYYALPQMTNPEGQTTQALYGFIRSLFKLFKQFSPEHIVAVFDGPDNKQQRQEIYEKYKANRVKAAEDLPEQIDLVKDFCDLVGVAHVELGGVEADDTMGSIAKWAEKEGMEVFLCTSDKDLMQLVGKNTFVLNPWKDNLKIDAKKVEELYGVPPEKIIDLLAIQGDASDNIPGLYGFGPKTAVSLLKEFGSLDAILKHPEKVKGKKKQETLQNEADTALLSRRLATIHTNLDFPKDNTLFASKETDFAALKAFYLKMGFSNLIRELDAKMETEPPKSDSTKKETVTYHLVEDEKSLEALIDTLKQHREICFDLETTALRPLEALPVGIGFGVRSQEAYYVPLNGKLDASFVLEKLKPLFEDPNIGFFGHNVKYDCHVLKNVGIAVARLSFDTILASYLLNAHNRRHSLDHLALQYFGKVKTSLKSLIGTGKKQITIDKVPIEQVANYCSEDVDYTFRLKELFAKELDKRKLASLLYDLELPLSQILAKMEREGMQLDLPLLKSLKKQIDHDLAIVQNKIFKAAGEEFNLNSPKQLGVILFDKLGIKPLKKTTTGYSTNAEVLETLAEEHPIAQEILTFRTLDKLRSTYIDTLPNEVNARTGRIHPTFLQYVAATGRLSCQDPNLQNIPVRTELGRTIRQAFHPARKGWVYLSSDYSQVELRLLAHLSEDPTLIKAFKAGEDIHAFTASLIFGIPLDKVTKLERFHAKAINFGIIYGQSVYGLAKELGIPYGDAASFMEAYAKRYPTIFEYVDTCIKMAEKEGKAVTMIGRERLIPEITSHNPQVKSAANRLAINTPLQGSAADLIKLAMLAIDEKIAKKNLETKLVLQIHDELIFEVPPNELSEVKSLVKKEMEGVFSLKVPLIVDQSVGKNWGEC